jgi:hypothetical protein
LLSPENEAMHAGPEPKPVPKPEASQP